MYVIRKRKLKVLLLHPNTALANGTAAMTEDMENAANSFIKQADIIEGMTDYDKALACMMFLSILHMTTVEAINDCTRCTERL